MYSFDVDIKINDDDIKWAQDIGNNITKPAWTLRPYLLSIEEMDKIKHISDQFPVKPEYAAILMTPANSICKTHVDAIAVNEKKDEAKKRGITQRITAINIPIAVHKTSMMDYMESMESDKIIHSVDLLSPKCWKVNIPHRIDNSQSEFNRVVLSLSYTQTLEELHEIYNRT